MLTECSQLGHSNVRVSYCLIPASGYYEWQNTPSGKQPYYFTARNGRPLTIAGLWDEWKDIETGEPLKSCTMIITTANAFVSEVHDRMPVLLQSSDFDRWLAGNAGTELLRPADNDYLQTWPVSKRVNSSRSPGDDPTLSDRIEATDPWEQSDLVRAGRIGAMTASDDQND